jgi:Xaa-Pro aminopeptidase
VYLPGKFGVRIEDDYATLESASPSSLSVRPGDLEILAS